MALTSVGYEGQVDESQIARAAQHFGPPVVEGVDDFKVEAVPGLDRTVRVLPGFADACFVRVENDTTTNVQAPIVASGKQWFTAVLRRDWTPPAGGDTTLELVPGTATATIAAGVEDDPGTVHDQLLALVEITAGVQAPTTVVDLRRWGPGGVYAKSLLAFGADPQIGSQAVVNGLRYTRIIDDGGSPVWWLHENSGHYTGSTSPAGTVTISHGLGRTPKVQVTLAVPSNSSLQQLTQFVVTGQNTTTFQVVFRRASDGVALGSNPIPFFWEVR